MNQLVTLTTNSAMEKDSSAIAAIQKEIETLSATFTKATTAQASASATLAAAQASPAVQAMTLADILQKHSGVAYSAADAPAQPGVYSEALGRMSKEQLITNLFNAGLGSVITQTDYSYIATNYNDRWQGYGHYYLDENGVLRSAGGGTYHADLGDGWSEGGVTSSAGITASVQANRSAAAAALSAAYSAASVATQQVVDANSKLMQAQETYNNLVAKYESTYGEAPQFAEGGISSGPEGGYMAQLHGTELVVSPRNGYPATVKGGYNVILIEEIRALRAEMKAGNVAIAKNTGKAALVLDRTLTKWDEQGIPAEATP
jgi:hypothetical protein